MGITASRLEPLHNGCTNFPALVLNVRPHVAARSLGGLYPFTLVVLTTCFCLQVFDMFTVHVAIPIAPLREQVVPVKFILAQLRLGLRGMHVIMGITASRLERIHNVCTNFPALVLNVRPHVAARSLGGLYPFTLVVLTTCFCLQVFDMFTFMSQYQSPPLEN